MASAGKELEQKLLKMGKNLISPPSDVDELLQLLDQTDSLLSKVNQSPSSSMAAAMHLIMKAIVAKSLLKHSNDDVKIYVASCLSEITRITAPDAPYDDELMKEIFGMIVETFKDLDHISGCLFSKRLSILETVAKVRSCLVMLDLECDKLVLDMFHHFFNTIREVHPERVFTAMETIMTLVLEESEDISSELVSCLLDNVKNNNKKVFPIAQSLGEKVIGKCAAQLRSSLVRVIQSSGADLTKYSKVVADICKLTPDGSSDSSSDETSDDDDSKLSDRTISEEFPEARKLLNDYNLTPADQKSGKKDKVVGHPKIGAAKNKASKSIMSNGTFEMRKELSLIANTESRHHGISKNTTVTAKTEPEKLVSVSIKSVRSSDKIIKKRGRKKSTETAAPFDGEHNELKSPKGDERNASSVSPIHGETHNGVSHRKRGRPSKALLHKEYETKSVSEPKSAEPSEKKMEKDSNDKQLRMKQRRKLTTEKGGIGEQIEKTEAKTHKNQSENGESSKTKSKGKSSSGSNKDPEKIIVGASIKVWWPDDKRFYDGVIDDYCPFTKKHRVLYADGDVEILRLQKERWEYVDNKSQSDEEKSQDHPSPDPDKMALKKSKASASKQTKMETTLKSSAAKHKERKAEPSGASACMAMESTGGLKGDVSKRKKKDETLSNDVLETADEIKISSNKKPKFERPEVTRKLNHGEAKVRKSNNTLNTEKKFKDEDPENDNKSHSNTQETESKYNDAPITSEKAMSIDAESNIASDVNGTDNTVSDSRADTVMANTPPGSANKGAKDDSSVPKTEPVVVQDSDGSTGKLCSILNSSDGEQQESG